jgi:3',5'-cyclic AMP phosphodiesterase CpdA
LDESGAIVRTASGVVYASPGFIKRMSSPTSKAIRLAHFSDIHISVPNLSWQRADWFNKRLTGWFNDRWLGRRHRFRKANSILTTFVADLPARHVDHLIFSGDATALGFEAEISQAAALLRVSEAEGKPGLAVPGNHDYYTRAAAASGWFERYFAPWQKGVRVDDATYPFAQRVGPVWLVAVNSSTGNRWAWDASGAVDAPQLDRLQRLLEKLDVGLRILVTHYPVCLKSGRNERRSHRLRNVRDVVQVAAAGGVGLWLHGHRHGPYVIAHPPQSPFPIVCAGSATQFGHWSYGEYTIEGQHLTGVRREFREPSRTFQDAESFELTLGAPVP